MSNWLDKALGRKDSTIRSEPFELNCECGTRLSGLRQARGKRMLCPQCGDAHFVLAANPYPTLNGASSGERQTAVNRPSSSPTAELDPPAPEALNVDEASNEIDVQDNAIHASIPDDTNVDDVLIDVNLVDDDGDDDDDFEFQESPEIDGLDFVLGDIPQAPPDPYRSSQTDERSSSSDLTDQAPLVKTKANESAEVEDEIELDLSLGLDVKGPASQDGLGQTDQQRLQSDSLFDDDAPLLADVPSQDISLDVPLLDDPANDEQDPANDPPAKTNPSQKTARNTEDIFNDDLSFDVDDEEDVINLATNDLNVDHRDIDDVIIEDSDYKPAIELIDEDDEADAIPIAAPPPVQMPQPEPKALQPQPEYETDEYDDFDENLPDDLVGDAFGGSDKYDYDDVEVAEVVDESLLPGAKRMARGKDRLKDFDHLAEDEVDERGDRPDGSGNRISISGLAKKNRKTRVKVFVVLGLLLAVGTMMTIWAVNNSNREQAATDLKTATEAGLLALEAGDFPTASTELKRAVAAATLLEVETDRTKHVKHLLSESEAAASQSNASLFEIVDRAEMAIKKNGLKDWGHEFDVNYRGRWIIFFGNINAEKEVELPVMIGNAPVRLTGIEKLIEVASQDSSGAILFAGQLVGCSKPQPNEDADAETPEKNASEDQPEDDGDADDFGNAGLSSNPDDEDPQEEPADQDEDEDKKRFAPREVVENVWEIRFDPETAVLWTRTKSLEQLNFIGRDDDLSKHIRSIVEQQNTAMGFPKDLGVESNTATAATSP